MFPFFSRTPQDAPLEKLRLLALLDKSPQAKLSVKANGTWQVTSRSPCLPQGKSREVTFLSESDFDDVESAFDNVLSMAESTERPEDSILMALSDALRGLSYHLRIRFQERVGRLFMCNNLPLTVDPRNRFQKIEKKVSKCYRDGVVENVFKTKFNQMPFVKESEFEHKGACFGIATYWCLRFIRAGKASYTARSRNRGAIEVARGDRISKKVPFIHELQHKKEKITEETNKTITIGQMFGDLSINPLLSNSFYAAAGVSTENPRNPVQLFVARKFDKYKDFLISNKKDKKLIGNSAIYSVPPNNGEIIRVVNDLVTQMRVAGDRAYVIALYFANRTEYKNDPGGADYFLEEHQDGHAVAVLADAAGKWSLLDPNYGELNEVQESALKDRFREVIAAYIVKRRLYRITLLEISGSA